MNMRLPDLITIYTATEKRAFTGAEGGFNDVRYTPVSYTHLDVYKRQRLRTAMRS